MTATRDEFGRLNVSDDVLVESAVGAMIAVCLSDEVVMKLLGCDKFEAQGFKEGAWADLSRVRQILKGASWA